MECPGCPQTCTVKNERRTANYQRTIWTFDYIQSIKSDYTDELYSRRLEELKQKVRQLLEETIEPVHQLCLIDSLQRLGVAYHFEMEIQVIMERLYHSTMEQANNFDLHATALYFRLLRQYGYNICSGIFSKFKDTEKGFFKTNLCEDAKGLLSLYQASHLGIQEEEILDETKAFALTHLNALIEKVKPSLARQIAHALEIPLHWRIVTLEARHYIDVYEEENGKVTIILELAKLNFNIVQSIHQREIRELSEWWDNMGLGKKLDFFRDRIVESFMWGLGGVPDPRLSKCRVVIAKIISFITVIDDIYDVYGSLDELELFTEVVERWDVDGVRKLPYYMKLCFLALYNTTNEFAYDILKEQGLEVVDYLKKLWAKQCKAFLEEARWFNTGYVPTLEEYLRNGQYSIGGPNVFCHAYVFLQQEITKEELDSISPDLNLLRWPSIIVRLCDDIQTYEMRQNVEIHPNQFNAICMKEASLKNLDVDI